MNRHSRGTRCWKASNHEGDSLHTFEKEEGGKGGDMDEKREVVGTRGQGREM